MGISNIAVDTFSSSGSQSITRANAADSSRQITSDFISRPPLKYINGSGPTVIRGTLTALPHSNGAILNNVDTFRIPNNIDAISEMNLNWTITITAPTSFYDCSGIYYSKTLPLDFIDFIDIKVGGLIIQTIYPGDIYMRNYSESGSLIENEDTFNNKLVYFDTGSIIGHQTASGETLNFSLSLPFIGKSFNNERSFLQTGTTTNALTVVVTYRYFPRLTNDNLNVLTLLNNIGTGVITSLETNLVIQNHVITHTERNFLKQNIVNRVLNTSFNIYRDPIPVPVSSSTGTTRIVLDLDPVNLNVSHILFCLHVGALTDTSSNLPTHFTRILRQGNNDSSSILISELIDASASDANSSGLRGEGIYTTGSRRLSSSWGEAILDVSGTDDNPGEISTPDVLGVFSGWLSTVELSLGNENTGEIPSTGLKSNQEAFGLKSISKNFYMLKLADRAFGTSGIPFSRIKNKTLTINIFNKFLSNTRFGAFSTVNARRRPTLYVTVCGTTLQNITNNFTTFSYI
jgi:hypothetical protein